MVPRRLFSLGAALLVLAALVVLAGPGPGPSTAEVLPGQQIPLDEDDIGGVVNGPDGPEAGVWVIAETTDLPTPFVRIVVTDDQGRYVLPDLPDAEYTVWVRGYGLVDSPRTRARPGMGLNLTAVEAPSRQAAARYYPAGYWFSMIEVPGEGEFPGTGPGGNGLAPAMESQEEFLRNLKSGYCTQCHQLGNEATRRIPDALEDFQTTHAAWERRLRSGQAGGQMRSAVARFGEERVLAMLADWTDRIRAGEVPPRPPRPEGLERNVVITEWDWSDRHSYLHDLVSTDRRDPTVNADGPVYGTQELSSDYMPVLDPETHETRRVPLTVRDPATEPAARQSMPAPSPYYGDTLLWTSKANAHNPMMDQEGRVWITQTVSPPDNPDFCREGSEHPSARLTPLDRAGRHLGVYDPDSGELTHVRTCFGTHHLMFALDDSNTLWTSGDTRVVGWLDTEEFLETGDEEAAQGWTALVLDTNGNGRRDPDPVGPGQPVDPDRDKRIRPGFVYGISPAPDGSVWASVLSSEPPGEVIRIVPGSNPPETTLTEVYELPLDNPDAPADARGGYSPRGMDIDRNGVVWTPLSSGHLARFDRRECEGPLNGPEATGQHCPEGWRLYEEPLPQMRGVEAPGSAEGSYYTWVDWHDASGLGAGTPINTGNASEGLLALVDEEWVVLRVPYPMGYYTKWMDGRIDDPDAGWKGRGLWTTVSTRAPFHQEGGRGTTSKVIRFQMRPDPLAH